MPKVPKVENPTGQRGVSCFKEQLNQSTMTNDK
jgi:hypothetical protein